MTIINLKTHVKQKFNKAFVFGYGLNFTSRYTVTYVHGNVHGIYQAYLKRHRMDRCRSFEPVYFRSK